MFTKTIIAGALILGFGSSAAHAGPPAAFGNGGGAQQVAEQACEGFNRSDAFVLASAEDGLGDYVVWLEDVQGGWWLCNASGEGSIFVYAPVDGDLLEGQGGQYVRISSATPGDIALDVCSAILPSGEVSQHLVVDDGVGDYLVWLQDTSDDLWLCNARADGQVFAYQQVDQALSAPAEAGLGATPSRPSRPQRPNGA